MNAQEMFNQMKYGVKPLKLRRCVFVIVIIVLPKYPHTPAPSFWHFTYIATVHGATLQTRTKTGLKVFNFIQYFSVMEWVMLQGKKKSRCRGGQELLRSALAPDKAFIWEYPESLIDLPLAFSKFKFLRLQFHFINPFRAECKGFLFLSLPSLPTSVSCLFLPPARHHSPLVIPVKLFV